MNKNESQQPQQPQQPQKPQQSQQKTEKKDYPRSRLFHIVQFEKNPKTGEILFGKSNIENGLTCRSIVKSAYIRHDKDFFSAEDEKKNPEHKVGTLKPAHWHIIIATRDSIPVDRIARFFNVEPQFVEIPKKQGREGLVGALQYLTHEKYSESEKHNYSDEEVSANFDFRGEIEKYNKEIQKFGRAISPKESLRLDVLYGGVSINTLRKTHPLEYSQDATMLEKHRVRYLNSAPLPKRRINYYICGKPGQGKGLLSIALARSLFPEFDDDEDIFFNTGGENVTFEGYDGQPVIIWEDFRSIEFFKTFKDRGRIFNVLDVLPKRGRFNVKYGSVNLINKVNIINSVQPWREFLNGLAGEYTDSSGIFHESEENYKDQSWRRFCAIIEQMHVQDYDTYVFLVNNGYFDDNENYTEFVEFYKGINLNKEILKKMDYDGEFAKKIQMQTCKAIVDKTKPLLKIPDYTLTEEDIEHFSKAGEPLKSEVILDAEFTEITEQVEIPFV